MTFCEADSGRRRRGSFFTGRIQTFHAKNSDIRRLCNSSNGDY